jgi:flagella basal body P-ring formation protein FlgA
MTIRLLRGLVLLLALTGPAMAAPVLRSEVKVTAALVTAGDMFDDASDLAEVPLFRAPAPGTSGIVSLEAVRQAAGLIGLNKFDATSVVRVRVTRDAVIVDAEMLTRLITTDLARRGIVNHGVTAATAFDQANLAFNAEVVPDPVSLATLRYMPGTGAFAARFMLAGQDAPVDLSGRIELMIEAPHLIASLRAGSVLQESDIEMKQVPLKFAETGGAAELADVVGKALVRQSRAGMMLRPSDVTEPELISRNEMITIYYRNGPLTLTVKGQALDGAGQGEAVQVLNLMSRKVLTAIAVSPGAVEISNNAQTVAGR